MEGIWGRYERNLRQRAAGKLEEARSKFRTKICGIINNTKRCELDAKRDRRIYGESGS